MNLLIVDTLPQDSEETGAALAALTAAVPEHKIVRTAEMEIRPCIGCNACWLQTPGICALKDDYEQLLRDYLQYDAVVFLAGTALGFVDHRMKNVIDRILPLVTMYTCFQNGQMRHVPRYEKFFRFGLLYEGEADGDYLNLWMERVVLNMGGVSMGAFPMGKAREVLSCIL
ncbi:MAG: flavodoxin family protein [Oscillospiraceae bacterium]|nr:flavodoxin family protein [Oscillospiraceae bacterium]